MATLHRDDSRETDRLTDTRKKVDDVSVVIIGALLLEGGRGEGGKGGRGRGMGGGGRGMGGGGGGGRKEEGEWKTHTLCIGRSI